MTHEHLQKMNDATTAMLKEISKPAIAQRENAVRGLGDAIDAVTTATGIKAGWQYLTGGKCGGCEERRRRMNEMFPFKG